jgi:hypothetical protein
MTADPRFVKPPVIIGGCGRSGTTLLLSILSAHPSIQAIPDETNVFCPTAYSKRVDRQAPFELARLQAILDALPVKPGATRWCEKTPKNVLFFGRLLEAIEGVHLINMVRDGRDVVASRHPERPDDAWVGLERWIEDVGAGVPFDGHPRVLVVRYEDLVRRFRETIERICAFLGEPVDERVLEWHRHASVRAHAAWSGGVRDLHADSLGKGQRPEHRRQHEALMCDPDAVRLLRHYGYVEPGARAAGAWRPAVVVRRLKRRVPPGLKQALRRLRGDHEVGWSPGQERTGR